MIKDLLQDLRYGFRTLRRTPGFTALVVVSLALGISANGTIFSLLNAVLFRQLPVPDPGQLVLFSEGRMSGVGRGSTPPSRANVVQLYSYPLYERLREQSPELTGLAAQQSSHAGATVVRQRYSAERPPDQAKGRAVTANFFDVLGVSASLGRTFTAEDQTAAGANPVIVLSHGYWQRRFDTDPMVIGEVLQVNGTQYTVAGVTTAGFTGVEIGEATDFWVPLTMQPQLTREEALMPLRNGWWLQLVGRKKAGGSVSGLQARANVILQRYLAEDPGYERERQSRQVLAYRIALEPGAGGFSGLRRGAREPLTVLMGGVGLLLLIVCLSVSHLLLARALARQREMGIRTALGASRARLTRQLLAEGLLLAGFGVLASTLLMPFLIDGLLSLTVSQAVRRGLDVTPDARVVGFTAGVAFATALILGLVPAAQASRADIQQALSATASSVTAGRSRRLASRLLLISQVAVSMVLLVGAGLLTGTLRKLRQVEKGFDETHLLLVGMNLSQIGLAEAQRLTFQQDLLQRVKALPGVRSASLSLFEILGGGRHSSSLGVPGNTNRVQTDVFVVTPGYFGTVGISLVLGRDLGPDDRSGGPLAAVVNETLARRLYRSPEGALGQRFLSEFDQPSPQSTYIVGVVRDAKINSLRGEPGPAAYVALAQSPDALTNSVQVSALGDPAVLAEQVRRTVQTAHAGIPMPSVRTMASQVERSLQDERILATLSTAFGLAALLLVSIGLYGVIAQWAAQRTREIGVRMALGATTGAVRWMVLRQGLRLVLAGALIGVPAALAVTQVLKGLLFGVSPMDPTTVTLAALILFAVAALAGYLPARRASGVDPMMALRSE